eukprot:TRINITY_DN3711_c0_g3_i1.p1 TRINITY_DN3711_c0_g3~~TRINITY_DN3711_c0_g3_i1.p1  ORF type:complete len:299 (-),score=66.72 TRINITY_DN3711_c0_g3_i1:6-902(-)
MAVLCATRCLWPLPLLLLLLLLLPPLMLLRTQPEPAAAAAAATRISVVYFTALRPAKWQGLVTLQLRALVDCGLAAAADSVSVLFSSVTEDAEGERLLREAAALASALLAGSRFTVRTQLGNHYELPGVRRAWELAVIDSGGGGGDPRRHLVLYHHGKGMFSAARLSDPARSPRVRLLTSAVVLPWRDVVRRFENDSAVNKAGFLAAPDGCACWRRLSSTTRTAGTSSTGSARSSTGAAAVAVAAARWCTTPEPTTRSASAQETALARSTITAPRALSGSSTSGAQTGAELCGDCRLL